MANQMPLVIGNDAYDIPSTEYVGDAKSPEWTSRFACLAEELRYVIKGPVFVRPNPQECGRHTINAEETDSEREMAKRLAQATPFEETTALFNSAALSVAWLVVRPRDTTDVATALAFCKRNSLSPSVRSGGFSTAGWAIQGELVLDMRDMNGFEFYPPHVRDVSQMKAWRAENQTHMSAAAGRSYEEGSSGGIGASKRHKGSPESGADGLASNGIGASSVPRTISGESGVDGDAENSSGRSRDDQSGQASRSDSTSHESRSARDELDDSERRHLHSSALNASANEKALNTLVSDETPSAVQKSAAAREWALRVSHEDQSAGSPSGSGGADHSRSGGSHTNGSGSGATPITSSVDADMADEKSDARHDSPTILGSLPRHDSPEQARWERHHKPFTSQSSSSNRLVLPTTGGFVWTAGDGRSQPATTRPLNATDPVYLGGATFPDLQAAQYSSADQTVRPYHTVEGLAMGNGFTSYTGLKSPVSSRLPLQTGTSNDTSLAPGIHKDKYRLVEFGPGVGVRELDVYTSGESSSGSPSCHSSLDKGKQRHVDTGASQLNGIEDVKMREAGLDFQRSGIAYHVPLSAYPVGSTAMTIGGFGYLSRAYGLSLDNIVELEIVLADGRIKVLNDSSKQSDDHEERELWWAVRGAAPCFGVVTRLVAKAYPVPKVYAGNLIFPFNAATAPSLVRHWRDCLKGTGEQIPRELYSNLILTAGPAVERRDHVIVIQICYLGTSSTEEIGASFVQAISSWTGERVLLKDIAEKSFLNQQDGVAQVLKSGHGRRWVVRGDLLTTLTDEVIGRTITQFVGMGNRAVWLFELVGGAIEDMGRAGETCVGLEQRQAKFTAAALQQWVEEEEDARCVSGIEKWVTEILAPASIGGPFAAFLERGETRKRCEGSFGSQNLKRLLQLKRRVDPDGTFTHTFGRGLQQFIDDEDAEQMSTSSGL